MAQPVIVQAGDAAVFGGNMRAVPTFTIATELIVYSNEYNVFIGNASLAS